MAGLSFGDIGSAEHQGSITEFPSVLLIGGKKKTDCGIFIREANATAAGWTGETNKYTHTYNNGNEDQGVWLPKIKFQILGSSARYIEHRKEDRTYILGRYDDPNSVTQSVNRERYYELRDELANNSDEYVRLRTLFLVLFLDDKNEALHTIPMILGVAGSAAVRMSQAITEYQKKWELTVCNAQGRQYAPSDDMVRAHIIYDFSFDKEVVGEGQKSSPIAIPVWNSLSLNPDTIEAQYFAAATSEMTITLLEVSSEFAEQYFSRYATAPSDGTAALPPVAETAGVLPPVTLDMNGANSFPVVESAPDAIPF